MEKEKIIEKVMQKREFSQLPKKDVEKALSHFERRDASDEEKARLSRELLHKVYGSFVSKKLLSLKNKDKEWILRKHLSTRERLSYYKEVYARIFKKVDSATVIDLGAGINGFSYAFFPIKINYIGVEAIGQLVDLANDYFKRNKIHGKMFHFSLFDIEKVKEIINAAKKPRIVFLFKTLDSLEMLERDYSKGLLNEIAPIVDQVVVSFATRSMIARRPFMVKRNWIVRFIEENFKILDDFELGGERYISFSK